MVKLVLQKRLGRAGTGGIDLGDLQGWLLKFGDHTKKLLISVESFVDCLANHNPPWASSQEFIPGNLI